MALFRKLTVRIFVASFFYDGRDILFTFFIVEDSLDSMVRYSSLSGICICVLLIIFARIASFSYLSIRVSPLSSIMLDFVHVLYLVSWGSHFVSALVFLISLYCTKKQNSYHRLTRRCCIYGDTSSVTILITRTLTYRKY